MEYISITARAQNRLEQIFEANPDSSGLRIYIQGGGCSGFEYNFELENQTHDGDLVSKFISNGQEFFICTDELSGTLLSGAELDFVANLSGARFVINNPNVSSQCSCGSSFSVS